VAKLLLYAVAAFFRFDKIIMPAMADATDAARIPTFAVSSSGVGQRKIGDEKRHGKTRIAFYRSRSLARSMNR